ncbi:MAG: ribonuclease HII [Bacilli bacterium]|nr:ribonuclease HII [Bacilli bacterium]
MAGLEYENKYRSMGHKFIVGTDEAGRGPIAGPLVVAACILPVDYDNPLIDDSKKLNEKKRELLFNEIKKVALDYSIEVLSVEEVDKFNIYKASKIGMERCLKKLTHPYDVVLTDAMPIDCAVPFEAIIKGDAKSQSIAAASILAKVTRDHIMMELASLYPEYDLENNKGYGTKKHLDAIEIHGILPIHRTTYEPIKSKLMEQLSFDI